MISQPLKKIIANYARTSQKLFAFGEISIYARHTFPRNSLIYLENLNKQSVYMPVTIFFFAFGENQYNICPSVYMIVNPCTDQGHEL